MELTPSLCAPRTFCNCNAPLVQLCSHQSVCLFHIIRPRLACFKNPFNIVHWMSDVIVHEKGLRHCKCLRRHVFPPLFALPHIIRSWPRATRFVWTLLFNCSVFVHTVSLKKKEKSRLCFVHENTWMGLFKSWCIVSVFSHLLDYAVTVAASHILE